MFIWVLWNIDELLVVDLWIGYDDGVVCVGVIVMVFWGIVGFFVGMFIVF